MYYDLLHSPDAVVADVDRTARTLVDRIGLLEPRPAWFQPSLCHGYRALFARVHPSRGVSPSRLEVISSGPRSPSPAATDIPAYIDEIAAMQGSRPCKTHATVLTSSAVSELVEDLRRRGVVHRVDPPSRDLGHERLWIGFAPDAGPRHSSDDDAGLFFEVIPTQCLELPAAVADGMVPDGLEVAPGKMVRVAARSHLVEHLDPVLATLEDRLSWPVERIEGNNGRRRAVMAVNFPRSAGSSWWSPGSIATLPSTSPGGDQEPMRPGSLFKISVPRPKTFGHGGPHSRPARSAVAPSVSEWGSTWFPAFSSTSSTTKLKAWKRSCRRSSRSKVTTTLHRQ